MVKYYMVILYIVILYGYIIWLMKVNNNLVGGFNMFQPSPLQNDGIKVSWDDDIPNIWKSHPNVPNHQPDNHITSLITLCFHKGWGNLCPTVRDSCGLPICPNSKDWGLVFPQTVSACLCL